MQDATTPGDITESARASIEGCPDERLRDVLRPLVGCLHGLALDVGLRQSEWEGGSDCLIDENRQEFILHSDTLGFSTLVDALAGVAPGTATESTILGPFWAASSPLREYGDSIGSR